MSDSNGWRLAAGDRLRRSAVTRQGSHSRARRIGLAPRSFDLPTPAARHPVSSVCGGAALGLLALAVLPVSGCSSAVRRLDPVYANREYRTELKFHFQSGITDPGILMQFEPGDIIVFSTGDPSSASFVALSHAMSDVSHVAIVIPLHKKLRVLSADAERGVYIDTIEGCVRNRNFYVFAFPPDLLDFERLNQFAERAVFLGTLDYDWSAIIGFNSNLTPNNLQEVGDEHTCATAVAAALHFSGLSLDRAWHGVVTPGDIIHSVARRNLNGPAVPRRGSGESPARDRKREAEAWDSLR